MTSVFVVLIVSPKLSQAEAKRSISRCIISSVLAFRAQSSAKRKSLITVSFTLVMDCRRLGLNTRPSVQYLRGIPSSESLKASVSIAANTMLKSVGASTQPCFTPLVIEKVSDMSPSSRTEAIIPSCNCRTTVMNVFEHPNFFIIFHRPSLLTVSKAFVRSTNVV